MNPDIRAALERIWGEVHPHWPPETYPHAFIGALAEAVERAINAGTRKGDDRL